MTLLHETLTVVLIGVGATLFMDIWLMFLKRLGVQTLNFAYIGRWVGHLCRGRVAHAAIGKAAPVRHELLLGWLTHYAAGLVFAGALVGLAGTGWVTVPSLLPAVALGVGTVVFPLFVMQPAMGLGVAALRTPAPLKNCLRSVLNHAVFGLGLFVSASVIAALR